MFFKKGVFENFVIFTAKHLCWGSLFNKVAERFFNGTPPAAVSMLGHHYFLTIILWKNKVIFKYIRTSTEFTRSGTQLIIDEEEGEALAKFSIPEHTYITKGRSR